MTALLFIAGLVGAAVVVVVRSLLVDETRGRLRRRVTESVEATIASLPPDLRDQWAEEWRADLEEVLAMPLTALVFARNLRVAARELTGDPVPAPAKTERSPLDRMDSLRDRWDGRRRAPALARWPGLARLRQWLNGPVTLRAAAAGAGVGAAVTGVATALNVSAIAFYAVAGTAVLGLFLGLCFWLLGVRRGRR